MGKVRRRLWRRKESRGCMCEAEVQKLNHEEVERGVICSFYSVEPSTAPPLLCSRRRDAIPS